MFFTNIKEVELLKKYVNVCKRLLFNNYPTKNSSSLVNLGSWRGTLSN